MCFYDSNYEASGLYKLLVNRRLFVRANPFSRSAKEIVCTPLATRVACLGESLASKNVGHERLFACLIS